jgi:hypothetical protein
MLFEPMKNTRFFTPKIDLKPLRRKGERQPKIDARHL